MHDLCYVYTSNHTYLIYCTTTIIEMKAYLVFVIFKFQHSVSCAMSINCTFNFILVAYSLYFILCQVPDSEQNNQIFNEFLKLLEIQTITLYMVQGHLYLIVIIMNIIIIIMIFNYLLLLFSLSLFRLLQAKLKVLHQYVLFMILSIIIHVPTLFIDTVCFCICYPCQFCCFNAFQQIS